jgi:hypothetical protein
MISESGRTTRPPPRARVAFHLALDFQLIEASQALLFDD